MEALVAKLRRAYPEFSFVVGPRPSWSPAAKQISYPKPGGQEVTWSLFHELGHGVARHDGYSSDIMLLQKEVEAWETAQQISSRYGIIIENDYIQDCLDTYRDWVYKRSTCPTCKHHGIQHAKVLYSCLNCQTTWKVTLHRFCRPYRLKKALTA